MIKSMAQRKIVWSIKIVQYKFNNLKLQVIIY